LNTWFTKWLAYDILQSQRIQVTGFLIGYYLWPESGWKTPQNLLDMIRYSIALFQFLKARLNHLKP